MLVQGSFLLRVEGLHPKHRHLIEQRVVFLLCPMRSFFPFVCLQVFLFLPLQAYNSLRFIMIFLPVPWINNFSLVQDDRSDKALASFDGLNAQCLLLHTRCIRRQLPNTFILRASRVVCRTWSRKTSAKAATWICPCTSSKCRRASQTSAAF